MNLDDVLDSLGARVSEQFRANETVLSFREYLELFLEQPRRHLRSAPQYILEMFEHFGARQTSRVGMDATRYQIFDAGASEDVVLYGQERAQESLHQYLLAFAKRGKADKMLLFHGPNGSGKTTLMESLVAGLERYSRCPEGLLLTFSWVFTEREGKLERIGFESGRDDENIESYAHLGAEEISSRFACELRCPPLYLIPREEREALIARALSTDESSGAPPLSHKRFAEGELCQKCRRIYETLLVAYRGDLSRVLRHVRVERVFASKRYRRAAVSIEPQGNVDAGTHPITSEHSWSIPIVLRNVTLYQAVGDIVDANRGILEYSDFLKRPPEINKYLLTTCERGTASLPNCMLYLDLMIFATANEKHLSLFKRSPDFSSFKGRIELIPVPYLLRYSVEGELYQRQIREVARGRDVTPHTAEVAALWAVLTRLRRPQAESFRGPLARIAPALSPLEKAKLYDRGEVPDSLGENEKKVLRAGIRLLRDEYEEIESEFEGLYGPEYEGRRGVSPREMLSVIAQAAESGRYRCLTPMAVFEAIEILVKDISLYDFLRIPPDGAYHDVRALLSLVEAEYLSWVTREVHDSIQLIDEKEYDRIFREYFRHVRAFDAHDKVHNATTGAYEPPSEDLLARIESLVETGDEVAEFRSNVMTRIAVWSLDHPNRPIEYESLFPEIYRALRDNFYRERSRVLTLIEQDILKYGTDEFQDLSEPEKKQVAVALTNMRERYGYSEEGAREVIAWVLKNAPRDAKSPEPDTTKPKSRSK